MDIDTVVMIVKARSKLQKNTAAALSPSLFELSWESFVLGKSGASRTRTDDHDSIDAIRYCVNQHNSNSMIER